jgi:poly-beta-1,6-N-acetyl-D-glucosamine synthase
MVEQKSLSHFKPAVSTEQANPVKLNYVLITPARNEEMFIEKTILSVVRQTVLPIRWVIVSDGSTDGTNAIINSYARKHNWIDCVLLPERRERNFAAKVNAFNIGFEKLDNIDFQLLANLDADITFEDDYFEYLLQQFAGNPHLGVGGTPFKEGSSQYDYRFTSRDHVSGACQLFRRECFKDIGGYIPIKEGGIDLVAVVTARMRGWETRTFTEKICLHHRKMGTAGQNQISGAFKGGYHDYLMGVHPIWQFFRSFYQMTKPPYFIYGSILLSGFFWAMVKRPRKPVSDEFIHFRRREQMQRLFRFIRKMLPSPGNWIIGTPRNLT